MLGGPEIMLVTNTKATTIVIFLIVNGTVKTTCNVRNTYNTLF